MLTVSQSDLFNQSITCSLVYDVVALHVTLSCHHRDSSYDLIACSTAVLQSHCTIKPSSHLISHLSSIIFSSSSSSITYLSYLSYTLHTRHSQIPPIFKLPWALTHLTMSLLLPPAPHRLLQTLGLTTTSILAGLSLSISVFLVPALLQSPTPLLLSQWRRAYHAGARTMAPLALLASSIHIYLAYSSYSHFALSELVWSPLKHQWRGYLAAAALAGGIVPYTLLLMRGTNNALMGAAQRADAEGAKWPDVGVQAATARQLLDDWATLNLGRALMLSAAALVGTWTALA
jgi:hypothetical protein